MSATARGVRFLVPLFLLALVLSLAVSWGDASLPVATASQPSGVDASGLIDSVQFSDPVGDAPRLDMVSCSVGFDTDYSAVVFIYSFSTLFNGFSQDESILVAIDQDMNSNTGLKMPSAGVGVDYTARIDYDSGIGYYAYIIDNSYPGNPMWEPIDAVVDPFFDKLYLRVPYKYFTNRRLFRFLSVTTIKNGPIYDYFPYLSHLVYSGPTTTTTLPPTTTTTVPATTTTTVPPTTTTTLPPSTTTTTAPPMPAFTDVPQWHSYALQISDMANRHVVDGYGNGLFGPDDWVKRQQFAKMIVLAMGYPVSEADVCSFGDVDRPMDNLYPDNYVAVAATRGITVGVTPGHFAPWNPITRAQLITMVARAAGVAEPPAGYSPPFGNFSATHYPWARRAAFAGLLSGLQGMGSGYDFWAPATRGEVCVVLYNLLHR